MRERAHCISSNLWIYQRFIFTSARRALLQRFSPIGKCNSTLPPGCWCKKLVQKAGASCTRLLQHAAARAHKLRHVRTHPQILTTKNLPRSQVCAQRPHSVPGANNIKCAARSNLIQLFAAYAHQAHENKVSVCIYRDSVSSSGLNLAAHESVWAASQERQPPRLYADFLQENAPLHLLVSCIINYFKRERPAQLTGLRGTKTLAALEDNSAGVSLKRLKSKFLTIPLTYEHAHLQNYVKEFS